MSQNAQVELAQTSVRFARLRQLSPVAMVLSPTRAPMG